MDEEAWSLLACPSVACGFAGESELLLAVGAGELAEAEDADWLQSATVVCTGFRTHRRICLFKLDITPNRRPQVSHTKANGGQSVLMKRMLWLGIPFSPVWTSKCYKSETCKLFLSDRLRTTHLLFAMC